MLGLQVGVAIGGQAVKLVVSSGSRSGESGKRKGLRAWAVLAKVRGLVILYLAVCGNPCPLPGSLTGWYRHSLNSLSQASFYSLFYNPRPFSDSTKHCIRGRAGRGAAIHAAHLPF